MIETDKEFEEKLAQLGRLYRAMRALWEKTDATSQESVVKWIRDAGKILETLGPVLGDLEEYVGAFELRLLLDQLATVREERRAKLERERV